MAKLPNQAQKVFEGKIFDVYQWRQQMFDGSLETFEMLKRKNTVQIIPTSGNTIYLSYEEQPSKPPFYGMLGGRIEDGENPLEAAKRELKEETGFESQDWVLFKEYQPITKIEWSIYFYIARNVVKTSEQNLDPGEKIQLLPYTFENAIEKMKSPDFRGQEIALDIFRMQYEENTLNTFKELLFPQELKI